MSNFRCGEIQNDSDDPANFTFFDIRGEAEEDAKNKSLNDPNSKFIVHQRTFEGETIEDDYWELIAIYQNGILIMSSEIAGRRN